MTTHNFTSLDEAVEQIDRAVWSAKCFLEEKTQGTSVQESAKAIKRARVLENIGACIWGIALLADVAAIGAFFAANFIINGYDAIEIRNSAGIVGIISILTLLLGCALFKLPDFIKGK